jgi:signal transduction histidine kinase
VKWWRRLGTRLFASYAAVTATGAVVLLVTIRLLVPRLFDDRVGAGLGPGGNGRGPAMRDALVASLDRALIIALVVSLAAAAVIAAAVAQQILRPIERVRTATRQLAAGHYDAQIDPPAEAELAALVDDVNALASALADTEQRRAELVSDVAHELRNPLTTIRGYAEGMLDGVITPDRDVLTAVLTEVGHLQRLAGDLSTLSNADEGRLTLADAPIDLHELAAAVVESLRPRAAEQHIELRVTGAPTTVRGDRDRLVQVVGNLVANAVTYTPRDGQVTVEVGASGEAATLTVTDTGIGLVPDDLERVFERFYRVHGVDRPPGGSGIGLAIARAVARAHGGDLVAASGGPGQGTTFTVRLPAATQPAAA